MTGSPSTVYSRAQKTGYITGPDHQLARGSQDDEEGPGDQDSSKVPDTVPNYREGDTPAQSCKACEHFTADDRECQKYDFTTKPTMTCDSFEPSEEDPDEKLAAGEMDGDSAMMPAGPASGGGDT